MVKAENVLNQLKFKKRAYFFKDTFLQSFITEIPEGKFPVEDCCIRSESNNINVAIG